MLTGPHAGTPRVDAAKLRAMLPGVPLVESPFFDEVAPACGFDAETMRIGKELNENGFAVLRFPDHEFDERADRIKRNLAPRFDIAGWRANGWQQNSGLRVQDAWQFDADVRAIATNARMLDILKNLYGRKAWPFQTLNFPVGTQQHYHSDSVHFSSIPERFMCGVWVALEDVGDDAGPLEYYPGSHKWPIVYNEQIGVRITGSGRQPSQELYHQVWEALVEKSGVAPQYFSPRKGDALIWAANLLHGGSRQRDPNATRWSQVTHYFFANCCYITPMASDLPVGKWQLRRLVDIATGKQVPNIYVGAPYANLGISFRIAESMAALRRALSPIARKLRR
jgi:hypothetical protein